ncbi:MAG: class B sortase [Clostridiales bacterium]|nr:class B sortase [Clostridiales bacterium]
MNQSATHKKQNAEMNGLVKQRGKTLRMIAIFAIYMAACLHVSCPFLSSQLEGGILQASSFKPFTSASAEEEIPQESQRVISDRFAELAEINDEVVSWLIAGTDIDTVVVYRDNDHYLDHDFYGRYSKGGTVFIDEENENWETDPYVIYYGHHMKDGSMFGPLIDYQELDYFKENTAIEVHSLYDNQVTQYVPFAVVDASVRLNHEEYFFLRRYETYASPIDSTAVHAFIAELQDRSLYEIPGLDVTAEDQIICLVTCSYRLKDGRLMVFCRRLHDGETAEEMAALIDANAVLKK